MTLDNNVLAVVVFFDLRVIRGRPRGVAYCV